MNTDSTEARGLAIVAGGLFALGTVGVVLEDVLLHSAPMTLSHWITVVIIAGTIMVGHEAPKAWRNKSRSYAVSLGVLFLAGTLLTVYSSVGRQAEHTMVASAQVEASDAARARALKGLAEAETMLASSQAALAKECASGKGRKCDGIRATVDVYDAAVRGHKAELERLGPAKVAVPEAKRAGELAAVFGADPAKVEAASIIVVPFLRAVFLELGAIILLGYGFRPVRRVTANDNRPTVEVEPLPPVTVAPPKADPKIIWAKQFRNANDRAPSIPEVQKAFPGTPKTSAWRVSKAA